MPVKALIVGIVIGAAVAVYVERRHHQSPAFKGAIDPKQHARTIESLTNARTAAYV